MDSIRGLLSYATFYQTLHELRSRRLTGSKSTHTLSLSHGPSPLDQMLIQARKTRGSSGRARCCTAIADLCFATDGDDQSCPFRGGRWLLVGRYYYSRISFHLMLV